MYTQKFIALKKEKININDFTIKPNIIKITFSFVCALEYLIVHGENVDFLLFLSFTFFTIIIIIFFHGFI